MRKVIKITGSAPLINDIISQVKVVNLEEENQIKFLGKNEFSMVGMDYRTNPDPAGSSNIDLIIEAENPMLFYKLGLYTAPLIKNIIK
jgi:hypothetical protein